MIEIDTGMREFHYNYLLPIKFKKKIKKSRTQSLLFIRENRNCLEFLK